MIEEEHDGGVRYFLNRLVFNLQHSEESGHIALAEVGRSFQVRGDRRNEEY